MLRVAMIGSGRIGKVHAANVASSPRCRLAVVVDAIEGAAQSLAATHACA